MILRISCLPFFTLDFCSSLSLSKTGAGGGCLGSYQPPPPHHFTSHTSAMIPYLWYHHSRWYQVGDLCRTLPSPLARSSVLRVRCIVAALLRCAPVWYHIPTAILLPHRAALAVVEDAVGGLGGVQLLDQQLCGQELGPPTLGPFLPTPGWAGPLPVGKKVGRRSTSEHPKKNTQYCCPPLPPEGREPLGTCSARNSGGQESLRWSLSYRP